MLNFSLVEEKRLNSHKISHSFWCGFLKLSETSGDRIHSTSVRGGLTNAVLKNIDCFATARLLKRAQKNCKPIINQQLFFHEFEQKSNLGNEKLLKFHLHDVFEQTHCDRDGPSITFRSSNF